MPNITEIVAALHARKSGKGWTAKCPTHEDATPSLSLCERNGRILLRCHAGCEQSEVIGALRDMGLWPERTRDPLRPYAEPDRDYVDDLSRARYWRDAVRLLADDVLEALPTAHSERYGLTRLIQIISHDTSLVSEYRAWRQRDPVFTRGLVWAGERHQARQQRKAALWLVNYCG